MTPHKPKAVVFDLGNVLLDFDYRKTVARIKDRCKLSEAELHALIAGSELFQKFEGGLVGVPEFFSELQKQSCYDGTLEEFGEFFGDVFTEVPEMIAWQNELRERGVPTYILSNTNDLSIRFIRKRYPFFKYFTGYIYSYEHRVMKPAARIYELVEEMAGLRGADLFYIDDREENAQGGAARGWKVSHHTTPARTLEIARGLGL